jgi:hypothetical protein
MIGRQVLGLERSEAWKKASSTTVALRQSLIKNVYQTICIGDMKDYES